MQDFSVDQLGPGLLASRRGRLGFLRTFCIAIGLLWCAPVYADDAVRAEIESYRVELEDLARQFPEGSASLLDEQPADKLSQRLIDCGVILAILVENKILPLDAKRLENEYTLAAKRVLSETSRSAVEVAQYVIALREMSRLEWTFISDQAIYAPKDSPSKIANSAMFQISNDECKGGGGMFRRRARVLGLPD